MSVCIFFGHSGCYSLDMDALQEVIGRLIGEGADTFYVGHQGQFDGAVLGMLKKFQSIYPYIQYWVVLAYMPTQRAGYDPYDGHTMYPEGLEPGPPRFAIERRNRWMIRQADHCVCYIDHPWGRAYKFARMAKRRGVAVTNLGSLEL